MSQVITYISNSGAGGYIQTLTGNSGGAVPPTAGNINTIGAGNINIVGVPGTSTLTASLVGTTNHAVQVGNSSGSITSLAVGTNGQVLVGSTAADPVFATLTSSDSSIAFTTGAGTLSMQVAGGTTVGKTITGNSGGSLSPTGGNWNILGSGSITTSGSGSTLTISVTGEGITWTVITASQTAAVQNGYFANKAGTLALALPATSAVGDVIECSNENTTTGIQLTQSSGQQILIGNSNTTSGATGTLTSTAVGDSLKLVCKVANTIWRATSIIGNWTPA